MDSKAEHSTQCVEKIRGLDMNQLLETLKSIMPVLDEIKCAVEHSTNKIPKATEQLTTVTQATESATIEILNLLDVLSQRTEKGEKELQWLQDELRREESLRMKLDALLTRLTQPTFKRYKVRHYVDELRPLVTVPLLSERVEMIRAQLNDARNIFMNIAMALQVQDITSQQIDSVRHLIDNVRVQLANVVGQYDGRELVTHDESIAQKSFDHDAVYTKDQTRQQDADSIVAQFKQLQFQK